MPIEDYRGPLTVRTVERIPWPGCEDKTIGVMLLNCEEIQLSYFAARRRLEKFGIDKADDAYKTGHMDSEFDVQALTPDEIDHFARWHDAMQIKARQEWKGYDYVDPYLQEVGRAMGMDKDADAAAIKDEAVRRLSSE